MIEFFLRRRQGGHSCSCFSFDFKMNSCFRRQGKSIDLRLYYGKHRDLDNLSSSVSTIAFLSPLDFRLVENPLFVLIIKTNLDFD
jgi:hypothetical protein